MKLILLIFLLFISSIINVKAREIFITSIDSTFRNRLLLNPNTTFISCDDSINCATVISNFLDKFTNLYCIVFFKTSDGGNRWECVSMDCSRWEYDGYINEYKYYQITNTGSFFYFSKTDEIIRSFNNGQIGKSSNWGITWTIEKDTIFDNYEIEDLKLVLLDSGKTLGYNQSPINGKGTGYARIFISNKDFRNWRNIPIDDTLNIQTIYSIFNFQDKYYLLNESLQDHYFHFYFTKTTDNGKNWTSYQLKLDSGRIHTSSMFFLNDSIGWIIGNYIKNGKSNISVFYTSDCGNSWDIISDFFSDIIHKYLFFYNKDEGVMLSSNMGFITNDGGKTWEKLTYHNNEAFPYPIKMLVSTRKNEFLCITNDGIIFKLIITN